MFAPCARFCEKLKKKLWVFPSRTTLLKTNWVRHQMLPACSLFEWERRTKTPAQWMLSCLRVHWTRFHSLPLAPACLFNFPIINSRSLESDRGFPGVGKLTWESVGCCSMQLMPGRDRRPSVQIENLIFHANNRLWLIKIAPLRLSQKMSRERNFPSRLSRYLRNLYVCGLQSGASLVKWKQNSSDREDGVTLIRRHSKVAAKLV